MVSSRGPLPKRSAERRRRNVVPGGTQVRVEDEVTIPPPPTKLHPIARRLYNSLAKSGQAAYFEPSDWEAARLAAELTSRMLSEDYFYFQRHWHTCDNHKCKCEVPAGEVNPKSIDAIWKLWQGLMVTEVDRRRARVEVERGLKETEDQPTAIDEYKARLVN